MCMKAIQQLYYTASTDTQMTMRWARYRPLQYVSTTMFGRPQFVHHNRRVLVTMMTVNSTWSDSFNVHTRLSIWLHNTMDESCVTIFHMSAGKTHCQLFRINFSSFNLSTSSTFYLFKRLRRNWNSIERLQSVTTPCLHLCIKLNLHARIVQ